VTEKDWRGWTIHYRFAVGNLFNGLEGIGCDRELSARNYAELAEAVLEELFPGAEIKVEVLKDVSESTDDLKIVPPSDADHKDLKWAVEAAKTFLDRVFYSGDWCIEYGPNTCHIVTISESGTFEIQQPEEVEYWPDVVAEADEVNYVSGILGWGPYSEHWTVRIGERLYHYLVVQPRYGAKEFADALGMSSNAFANARTRGQIPKPAFEVASGPIWTHHQVEEYKRERARQLARRKNPEVVVVREHLSGDPGAKPYRVTYHERDGMPAYLTETFDTLEEAIESVPGRFELEEPDEDADGHVIYVGHIRPGAEA